MLIIVQFGLFLDKLTFHLGDLDLGGFNLMETLKSSVAALDLFQLVEVEGLEGRQEGEV